MAATKKLGFQLGYQVTHWAASNWPQRLWPRGAVWPRRRGADAAVAGTQTAQTTGPPTRLLPCFTSSSGCPALLRPHSDYPWKSRPGCAWRPSGRHRNSRPTRLSSGRFVQHIGRHRFISRLQVLTRVVFFARFAHRSRLMDSAFFLGLMKLFSALPW